MELLEHELRNICEGCVIFEVCLGYKRFLSLPLLVQLLNLGQLCQIESENKILQKFIDMTKENFNVELRKVIM